MVIMNSSFHAFLVIAKLNQYGKWLVDLCTDNQMYIVNGRTLGDFIGKFTCHTPRGSSVVDNVISSRSLPNTIFSMYVHDVSLIFLIIVH